MTNENSPAPDAANVGVDVKDFGGCSYHPEDWDTLGKLLGHISSMHNMTVAISTYDRLRSIFDKGWKP